MHTGIRPDATFFTQEYMAWLPEDPEDSSYTREIHAVARRVIEKELQGKGYVFCPDSATIYLKLRVNNEEGEERLILPPGNWPYAPLVYSYLESSITLTVHDKENNHMWWACTVRGKIYNIRHMNKGVMRAMKDMMQNFPAQMPIPFELIFYKDELLIKTL